MLSNSRKDFGEDVENLEKFKNAVDEYNTAIDNLINDGVLAENLDAKHYLPSEIVECILKQVYDRVVSPEIELVRQYENGTDNIYGELLPPFVSKILKQTGLGSWVIGSQGVG